VSKLPEYRHFSDRSVWIEAASHTIATHVLGVKNRPSLFLSGGTTPGPVYEALAKLTLPWDKLTVGLVDERWVDETDSRSNAALIRNNLQNGKGTKFVPMKTAAKSSFDGQEDVAKLYNNIVSENSVAVLGMGTDGHVCSWFPDAEGLEAALDLKNKSSVQAIKLKSDSAIAAERMTLTYSAIAKCKAVIVLITGEAKRALIERVLSGAEPDLPVACLLNLNPHKLTILHAA